MSSENGNHLPLDLAHFVRDIYSKIRKRTGIGAVEFDEIAHRVDLGVICGYVQFRTGYTRQVWGWVVHCGLLWIDADGPTYFETTSLIVGNHTVKLWQGMMHGM